MSDKRFVKDLDVKEGSDQFFFLVGFLHGHFIVDDTMKLADWNKAVDESKRFQVTVDEIRNRVKQGK